MERIINKIIKENFELWNINPSIEKVNAGFTNLIYKIDNKYILKICIDAQNETAFKNEINFYLKNKGNKNIPKLLKYNINKKEVPYIYEILEKLEGESLYNVWHTLSEPERENIIKKICAILKSFHKTKGPSYDWSKYIKHQVEKYLNNMIKENLLDKEEIKLINEAISCFDKYLQSREFVFIHNDIHFDNIIYKDGTIKVIDFERSMIAPPDKELDIFFRMIDMPWKYANEISERYVIKEDYQNIKQYVAKYYPEILNIPYLDVRLAIYNLREYLRAYYFYQSEIDLKDKIIVSAKFIISGKNK